MVLPCVLTYHKIGPQSELGITTVSRRRFTAHLDFMARLGTRFICATEAAASRGETNQVAITFDDGYESVYTDGLPEMQVRGVRGTVFPVVGYIDGYNKWDVQLSRQPFRHLSWSQIEDLVQRGFEIGSHTLSHKDLTKLDPKRLRDELRVSKQLLEDRIGVGVKSISYPFGRYSQRVVDEALDAGYSYGFTSYPQPTWNQMAIGRMTVYAIDGCMSVARKLRVRAGYSFECLKNRVIARLSLGTTIVKR